MTQPRERDKAPVRRGLPAQQRVAQNLVRRLGPWRYLQFALVAVVAGWLAARFGGLEPMVATLVGIAAGIGYFLLERARGTV